MFLFRLRSPVHAFVECISKSWGVQCVCNRSGFFFMKVSVMLNFVCDMRSGKSGDGDGFAVLRHCRTVRDQSNLT